MDQKSSFRFDSISVFCVLRQLWKDLWMLVACALIFSMLAFLYASFLRTPVYSATMTYAVTSKVSAYYSGRNILAATDAAEVLSEVLNDSSVKDDIFAKSEELSGFSGEISAQQIENSNFIVVTSTAATPKQAFLALDALSSSFPELSKYISGSILQVIKAPSVSPSPSNGINTARLCRNAGIAGAVLMAAAIAMSSIMSETVQTREGARALLDAAVIAVIGHERRFDGEKKRLPRFGAKRRELQRSPILISSPTVSMLYTEQINSICSRLEYEKREKGCNVFLVTSVAASEGKSTVSANLAIALVNNGHHVALIDADLRNPSQYGIFGHRRDGVMPLNELLSQEFSDDNMRACARIDSETNVLLLCSNEGAERSTELLSSPCMTSLLGRLRNLGYMIIIDSPPMGLFPDSEILADLSDAALMVVRQDVVPASTLNDAVDVLSACRCRFLGCVLNDMHGDSAAAHGYGRYGYGKKYQYGYGKNSSTEAKS